jgi:hypothetical protein
MLILHIGAPKTGTTALQSFLHSNEAVLREKGLNYMQAARTHIAHNPLPQAVPAGNEAPLIKAIIDEYQAAPDQTHIISSEIMFRVLVAQKLQDTLPDVLRENTKVICYLRRQDDHAEVMYKQRVKNGWLGDADRASYLNSIINRLNYSPLLGAYANIFGPQNILVRPFERNNLLNGDVIDDFLALIGHNDLATLPRTEDAMNSSLSAELSEMIGAIAGMDGVNTRELIRALLSRDPEGIIQKRDVFDAKTRAWLVHKFAADNEIVRQTYCPERITLFPAPEDATTTARAGLDPRSVRALIEALRDTHALAGQPPAEPIPNETPEPAEDEPPTWFHEIHPAGPQDGFYQKFSPYSLSFVARDPAMLVITFENLYNVGNPALKREPWAQKFCADRGWSHMGVYAEKPTWFRHEPLMDYFADLSAKGFFAGFETVGLAGTSMGGYAALAYSSFAPGANVLAFSPQSTLHKDLVPWETRFAPGRAADWSGALADGAKETAQAQNAYIIYDGFHDFDRRHAQRIQGTNVHHLPAYGVGHKSALVINRMGHLKTVMEKGLIGTLSNSHFFNLMRNRKDIYLYRETIAGYLEARDQNERAEQFRTLFRRRRRIMARQAAKQT